jgi:Rrf2 family transcriptional regulator, iron-sulfur cluster assembly transcription factor
MPVAALLTADGHGHLTSRTISSKLKIMQFALGRRGDYAVRAAVFLARRHPERCKGHDIAADMVIPANFVPQIVGDLVKAGLATSQAGPQGGYSLSRAPENISLLEVVEAAGGPLLSTECILRGGPCRWEGTCAVHDFWAAGQEAMVAELGKASLAAIASRDEDLERLTT